MQAVAASTVLPIRRPASATCRLLPALPAHCPHLRPCLLTSLSAEPALTQSFPGVTKQEPQGKRLLEMVVPPTLAPSLAADLVECKYWLEVSGWPLPIGRCQLQLDASWHRPPLHEWECKETKFINTR